MSKNKRQFLLRITAFLLCISIIIATPILIATNQSAHSDSKSDTMAVITIWQIDSFEGGKGSRANYLQTIWKECFKDSKSYVNVISITAAAARANILNGNTPDLISYGAGTYGIEGIICGKTPYYTWAHGGYCFLATDESADFSDINNTNTVINKGTDNLTGAAALICGVEKANKSTPTGAYVSLIHGEYKYLLGTQRDIYRLKTRGINFKIKPITEFNDLYQNISITTNDIKKTAKATKFIEYLLNQNKNITKIGLMGNNKYYEDEMSQMESLTYGYKLTSPISEETHISLLNAIEKSNLNLLKKLLK